MLYVSLVHIFTIVHLRRFSSFGNFEALPFWQWTATGFVNMKDTVHSFYGTIGMIELHV